MNLSTTRLETNEIAKQKWLIPNPYSLSKCWLKQAREKTKKGEKEEAPGNEGKNGKKELLGLKDGGKSAQRADSPLGSGVKKQSRLRMGCYLSLSRHGKHEKIGAGAEDIQFGFQLG